MKRVLSIASVLFAFVFAVSLAAQAPAKIGSEADYAATMKEIGSLNGGLTKAIKGGDAAEAGKAVPRMEVLFKSVHAYWADKKVADATTAAMTAVTSLGGDLESARGQRHDRGRSGAHHARRAVHGLPQGTSREDA